MNALIRLFRSLPLIILFVVLALVVYAVVASRDSSDRAKVVLLRLFGAVTSFLTVLFSVGVAYALLEDNMFAADISAGFAVVSAVALGITLVCRHRFLKNRPAWRQDHPGRWSRFV